MVRITKGILKHASGKIGEQVFRIMNNKTFASSRPEKYNISHSKGAVARRTKFSTAIEFSKYVNSIPALNKVWKSAKIKGTTSFNRLVKYNSKYIGEKSPTIHNMITPSVDFPSKNVFYFPFRELHFSKEAGMIKIVMLDKADDFEFNKDYDLTFVFMLIEPKRKSDKFFLLDHLAMSYNITEDLAEINIDLDKSFLPKLNRYKRLVIYFAASRDVGGRLKYLWSPTFAKEFSLLSI